MVSKRSVMLFLLVLVVFLTPYPVAAVTELDATGLKTLMDSKNVTVIFPLSRIEFNDLHIPGSIHLGIEDVPAKLPPDKKRPLAFYCLGRS
jgi:rhodanese-related sulfurtransferase